MVVSIKDLFAKYAKLEPKEKHIKEALVKAVVECTQHTILTTDIKIQNSTAFITCHPLLKKEILSRKGDIVQVTERLLSKKAITAIQ